MPATLYACHENVRRIRAAGDPDINKITNQAIKKFGEMTDENAHEIWGYIKDTAAEKKIGDRLPGTVGRQFAAEYGKVKHRPPKEKLVIKLSQAGMDAVKDAGYRNRLIESDLTHDAAVLKGKTLHVYAAGASRDILVRWADEPEETKERARRDQVIKPIVRQLEAILPGPRSK